MDEKTYRHLVEETFEQIERAFDEVDPDRVELIRVGDTLQFTFSGGQRAILSPQPPRRQLWLAARQEGLHFDYNERRKVWATEEDFELYPYLADLVVEESGVLVSF